METVANEGKNIRAHGSYSAAPTISVCVTFVHVLFCIPSACSGGRAKVVFYLPLYTQSLICISSWCLAHKKQPINI